MVFNELRKLYNHHQHELQNIFITPQKKLHTHLLSLPIFRSPEPLAATNLLRSHRFAYSEYFT